MDPTLVTCKNCNGEGMVIVNLKRGYRKMYCPVCGGKGYAKSNSDKDKGKEIQRNRTD